MNSRSRAIGGRWRVVAKALAIAAVTVGATVAATAPVEAAATARPHFEEGESFLAYTDSATPDTTTYPAGSGGFLQVGSWQDDAGAHTSRVYVGFDIGSVPRVRLQNAIVIVREGAVNDCSKPRQLTAQATDPFAENTWANPPAVWGKAVAAVAEGTGCSSYTVRFDVTEALDRTLRRAESRLWLEIRVPRQFERNVAYGRSLETNDFRIEVTLTNTVPTTPKRLTINDVPCTGSYFANGDFSVTADLTDADRSPWDALESEMEFWPAADPSDTTPVQTHQISGGDGVLGGATMPAGSLDDGEYAWHARTFDLRARSGWSAPCAFTVDRTAPVTAPTVSSPEYPENSPVPTGGVGRPATFLFTANGVADVEAFYYGDSEWNIWNRVPADQLGGAEAIQWTANNAGVQKLYVVSVDRAGNRSPVREYSFNVRSFTLNAWSTTQVADPDGAPGLAVTLHFETQAGNGIASVRYSVDGGPEQSVAMGANGVADAVITPLRCCEHQLSYAGLSSTGEVLFESLTYFYAVDDPDIASDGVYPLDGSGGGVGVPGIFTVTPKIAAGATAVRYFTTAQTDPVDVALDEDGKARISWTPTQSGWHYFWFTVVYSDDTTSASRSFSVTVAE